METQTEMKIKIRTYTGQEYIVKEKTAEQINQAIIEDAKFVQLFELRVTLAISDIAAMDPVAPIDDFEPVSNAIEGPKKFSLDIPKDFYSAEETAKRRAENKLKYAPKRPMGHINTEANPFELTKKPAEAD